MLQKRLGKKRVGIEIKGNEIETIKPDENKIMSTLSTQLQNDKFSALYLEHNVKIYYSA